MKKFFISTTFVLVFCIAFIAGCSKDISKSADAFKILKFEDIKSAKIELATAGAIPAKNLIFDLNNTEHTKIIKEVVSYLNSAKVQGYADEKFINKGGSPTFLILELKEGSIIQIKSAVGGKVTKFSNGSTEISQSNIPNQVTIITKSKEKPFRILSPEINELINSGYKNIFKANI